MQKHDNEEKCVSGSEILKLKEFGDIFECDETDGFERAKMLEEYIEKIFEELEEKIRKHIAKLLEDNDVWTGIRDGEYDLEVFFESDNIEIDMKENKFSFENVEFNSTNRFGDSEDNDPEYFKHRKIVNGIGEFKYSVGKVIEIYNLKIKEIEKDIKQVTKRYNNTPCRPWHSAS